jgi:glycosyltransferase involved in cell wall biosynthesis
LITPVETLPTLKPDNLRDSVRGSLPKSAPLRVAIICDLVEENWPSMDLVAENLLEHLRCDHQNSIAATRICPALQRRFARLQPDSWTLFNADRLVNRFIDYPRLMGRISSDFDLFHIIDHSYSQLLHRLPPERTVITCHDLDTFQSVLGSNGERRRLPFKLMARRILDGFKKAALVTTVSSATRDQLLGFGLFAPERIVVVPNGIDAAYSEQPDPVADAKAARMLETQRKDALDILHVGNNVPRKRIDLLLRVLSRLKEEFPRIRLVRVGGPFTPEQNHLISQLKLGDSICVLPFLEKPVLAAVNRRAVLVLQPSEREGFGLPVIEAMACGTPVLASDIPALREVGGEACEYAPVGDLQAWTKSVSDLINERNQHPDRWTRRRQAGIANASRFSWSEHANQMAFLYRELLAGVQMLIVP